MSKKVQKQHAGTSKIAKDEKPPGRVNIDNANKLTWTTLTTTSNVAAIGTPTYVATMRLGDNNAASGGTTELILNGISGQVGWGTDENNNLNTSVNYANGWPFELSIPAGATGGNPQAPATLIVGEGEIPTISFTLTSSTYSTITGVCVEAIVNSGGTPVDCVWVSVVDLAVNTYDAGGNTAINPSPVGDPNNDPCASQGDACSVGTGDNVFALYAVPVAPYVPVSVNVDGYLVLMSTDAYFQNAGAHLSSTSVQLKILVYTS